MASRSLEEDYPLVHRAASEESFVGLGLNSRISSVLDLSRTGSFEAGQYSPDIRHVNSQGFSVSPQSSSSDLQSRVSHRTALGSDGIDISHVRISSIPESSVDDQQRSRLLTESPASLRSGPPPSPSAGSNSNGFSSWQSPIAYAPSPTAQPNIKRSSWQSTDEYVPYSPIDKTSQLVRGLSGRFHSIRTSGQWKRPSKSHTIAEEGEEMNMGLVASASLLGVGGTSYSSVYHEDNYDDEPGLGVDISSFTGPMGPQDEATMLQYRRLESEGQLTGGLGTGFKPDARISSQYLLAGATSSPIDISRRLTKRASGLNRAPTLKDLGQAEANKRGQIIEVVVEEPSNVDLSSFGGDDISEPDFDPKLDKRKTTFAIAKVETYYPQSNWKPISMRWPYLTALISISITLAAVQEYLYQRSNYKSQLVPKQGLYAFNVPQELSNWDYFSFKYLPSMLTVTYGILWQITDYDVKRLEAYYQLSREGGALAAESINVDYITVFNILRPIRAFRYKHFAVAFSSIATLLAVSLVPTLQSASIVLEPDRATRLANPDGPKFVNVHPVWSRIMTAVLVVISIMGCCLLYLLHRRRSGLVADVKGIAGIAAMATKSHVLMDFKGLDTVPPRDIHNKLKDHRYTLRNSSLAPDDTVPVTRDDKDKYNQYRLSENPQPLMLRQVPGYSLIAAMVFFLAFIPVVLFSPANIITDKAPWLLTAFAVIIKISFQVLEQDIRMLEPFYRLSCRHAPAKVLTLDYTGMAFAYMPIRATLNGDYLVALVGFGSVLAEVLTVSITSFAGVTGGNFLPPPSHQTPTGANPTTPNTTSPDSGEETFLSFWISFALSMCILAYLITTATCTLLLRHHAFLPRQPSTIASVLAFIHQSKMLYDFVSPHHPLLQATKPGIIRLGHRKPEDSDAVLARLQDAGKTFGFGWFTGRDGETHCGIDQEELRGGYRHKAAEDVRQATKPWLGNWEHY